MLTGGTDGLYRRVLGAPQTEYVLVEVLDNSGNVLTIPRGSRAPDGGLVILENSSVTATLSSRVTRQCTIEVDQSLYPALTTDLLAPYGNRLRVTRGVRLGNGDTRYSWVVFTGRIHQAVQSPDGTVSVLALDRANEVVEAEFTLPTSSTVGVTLETQFRALISDGVPTATFGTSDAPVLTMPQLTWESDRAGALDEIAASGGCFWYALASGDYVMRRYAWTTDTAPVVTLADGQAGLIMGSPSRDRDGVYNSVTVTAERTDGSDPVYARAQDINPASPTWISGPFGLKHRTVSLQTPQTPGTAQAAANDWLRMSVGMFETWRWEQVPDAAMELGDVVSLTAFGRTGIIQVVSGFTLPLAPGATMSVQAHAQVVGALE